MCVFWFSYLQFIFIIFLLNVRFSSMNLFDFFLNKLLITNVFLNRKICGLLHIHLLVNVIIFLFFVFL
jgi:hypothetical protein